MAKNSAYTRQLFEAAYKKYGVAPAPHFLRAEQVITNDKSSYTFQMKTTNQDLRTESKLDPNDLFITLGLGLFLEREIVGKEGSAVLQSFPNPANFPDDGANFIGSHLETFYNGYMQMTTGQNVTIEKLPTVVFRNVPQAQQINTQLLNGAPIYAVDSVPANQFAIEDMLYSGGEDILIDGGKTQSFKIEIPTFEGIKVASSDSENYKHKLVLFAMGIILKGKGFKG